MIQSCAAGTYKGQHLSKVPGGEQAQCQQPKQGRQLCAVRIMYPEKRVYAYKDARRYSAIAQADTWFNIVVDENNLVLQCRSQTK